MGTATPSRWIEHHYADGESLATGLADAVGERLRAGLHVRGSALLAVSGGNTPRRFLRALARQSLDWTRITVTLADERCVPADHEQSNERLVRELLLRDDAAAARFVPLRAEDADVESATAARIDALPLPFDAVVLGMGLDGHVASLFPAGDRLREALDPRGKARVLPLRAPDATVPRVTLTLAALTATRALYLHIEGAAKRAVFEQAMAATTEILPVAAVVRAAPVATQLHWCP
jgi:6-phosphogluconolactonase